MNQILLSALVGFFAGCGGLLFAKLIVDPYLEYRGILKEISRALMFHGGLIFSAPFPVRANYADPDAFKKASEEYMAVSREVRDLSARLRACVTPLLRFLRLVPPQEKLKDAAGRLIRISNCMLDQKKNYDLIFQDLKAIASLLNIDVGNV